MVNVINETPDTMPDIMETVLFTDLSAGMIGKAKPSEFHKIMKFVAAGDRYTLKKQSDYKKAKEEIINQIKYN